MDAVFCWSSASNLEFFHACEFMAVDLEQMPASFREAFGAERPEGAETLLAWDLHKDSEGESEDENMSLDGPVNDGQAAIPAEGQGVLARVTHEVKAEQE